MLTFDRPVTRQLSYNVSLTTTNFNSSNSNGIILEKKGFPDLRVGGRVDTIT
jgi:hypothetical protein